MIHSMLAAESDARAAQVPDLFVRITAPFESASAYAAAVRKEFLEQYTTSWDVLPESERPPKFEAAPGDLHATCAAFLLHHDKVFEHLVLVLTPSEVEDDGEFAEWLAQAAVQAGPTPRLRFLVLMARGEAEATAQAVVQQAQGRACVQTPDLNMPAALEALSRQAGGLGSPGGRFRHLFVQLTNALGAGDFAQAERLAGSALAITQAQGWPSLSVAVHFALGGGALAAGRPQDAIPKYQAAIESARAAVQAGAAEGGALELRARLAIASAQLRSGDYVAAAATYEQAAPLATAQSDLRMQLECWRMASFCHESAGSPQRAWEHAQRALAVGQNMDPETRATSTLPYLGAALERLSANNLPGLTADQVERRMGGLLGEKWRSAMVY
ncbi:MAG: hypothetical protein U1A78_23030 [Polyangia bacterium]